MEADVRIGLLGCQAQLDQLSQVSRLGLVAGQLGVDRLELDERLTRPDAVSHVVQHPGHASRSLGADGHLLPAAQAANHVDRPLDGAVFQGRHGDGHGFRRGRPLGRRLRAGG